MNHTTNYNLPQWEDTDRVTRTDVNAAMSTIDAAIAGVGNCRVAYGTYTGTGTFGNSSPNTLTFDFEPKLVIVQSINSATFTPGSDYILSILFLMRGVRLYYCGDNSSNYISWSGNSVSWYGGTAVGQLNKNGFNYIYVAIG